MNTQAIKEKIRLKKPVTVEELVAGITNSRHLLFNYIMDNDLAQLNSILRVRLGITDLPFEPSRPAIEAYINGFIMKDDKASLNKILSYFRHNFNTQNYTNNPDLVNNLQSLFK